MANGEPLMTRHIGSSRVLASIVVAAFVPPLHAQAGAAAVPLCPGLTIVSRDQPPRGRLRVDQDDRERRRAWGPGELLRPGAHPARVAPQLADAPHGAARRPRHGHAVRALLPLPWLAHDPGKHRARRLHGGAALAQAHRRGRARAHRRGEPRLPRRPVEGAEPVRLRGDLEAPAGRHRDGPGTGDGERRCRNAPHDPRPRLPHRRQGGLLLPRRRGESARAAVCVRERRRTRWSRPTS